MVNLSGSNVTIVNRDTRPILTTTARYILIAELNVIEKIYTKINRITFSNIEYICHFRFNRFLWNKPKRPETTKLNGRYSKIILNTNTFMSGNLGVRRPITRNDTTKNGALFLRQKKTYLNFFSISFVPFSWAVTC
jgi:hypothetical protein